MVKNLDTEPDFLSSNPGFTTSELCSFAVPECSYLQNGKRNGTDRWYIHVYLFLLPIFTPYLLSNKY